MRRKYRQPHHAPRFVPLRAEQTDAQTLDLPGYRQGRTYSCGYACALMVSRYYDIDIAGAELFNRLGTGRSGTTQSAIIRELRACGLRANVRYDVDLARIRSEIDRDKLIISYLADAEHWIVIYGYAHQPERIYVADPRPDEPCEQIWHGYHQRLRGFGIICSRGPAAETRRERKQPAATQMGLRNCHPLAVAGAPLQMEFEF